MLQVTNGTFKQTLDTNVLSDAEINKAKIQNTNQIDKASKYDYLKNQKPDTNVDKSVYKKDSLNIIIQNLFIQSAQLKKSLFLVSFKMKKLC